MATVQSPGEQYVEFDEYVDYQLDRARNGIKWTEILTAGAGVAALVVGYLVLFVVADHWFFEDGVPQGLRLLSLSLVVIASVGWIGFKIVWPYLKKVNDLYAARMLERAEPSLRGSLFGLVDSRRAGRAPVEEVRRALEKRAATTLSSIDLETALDRKPLMRMSYVLLAVVLAACAYAILSPKRIGPSLLRALAPSSQIGVATRTEILDVRPGDANVLAGSQLEVAVLIRGETPEKVMLYYSTADRRFADEPIEMRLSDETTREYRAALIGDVGRGLSQDLTYRVEANDDAAGPFTVKVEQPPVATVTSVALQYPPYTRREPEVRDLAPIDAVEGTNVTLAAKANRPLKAAKLVFADDERFLARGEEVPLRIDANGTDLTAQWKLAIRSDGTSPSFYRIECRDLEGKTNPDPAVYPIAIRPDQVPEISLHDPKSDLERPANAIVPLIVTARDPDFELREIILRLERKGQELPERTVLWEGADSTAAVRHDWDLAPLGLKPGDVLTFYVQARDNREPESNRRNSPKLNITITEPISEDEVQEQLAQERQRQDKELETTEANDATSDRGEQPEGSASEEMQPNETNETPNGDPENQPREDDAQAEQSETQSSSSEENGSGDRTPVKNDGSQDDEVLRRLIERQREQPDQPPAENEPNQQQQSGEEQKGRDGQKQSGDGGKGENANDQGQAGSGQREQQQPAQQRPEGEPQSEQERPEAGGAKTDPDDPQSQQAGEQGQQQKNASGKQENKGGTQSGESGNSETGGAGESKAPSNQKTAGEEPSKGGASQNSEGQEPGKSGREPNGTSSAESQPGDGDMSSGSESGDSPKSGTETTEGAESPDASGKSPEDSGDRNGSGQSTQSNEPADGTPSEPQEGTEDDSEGRPSETNEGMTKDPSGSPPQNGQPEPSEGAEGTPADSVPDGQQGAGEESQPGSRQGSKEPTGKSEDPTAKGRDASEEATGKPSGDDDGAPSNHARQRAERSEDKAAKDEAAADAASKDPGNQTQPPKSSSQGKPGSQQAGGNAAQDQQGASNGEDAPGSEPGDAPNGESAADGMSEEGAEGDGPASEGGKGSDERKSGESPRESKGGEGDDSQQKSPDNGGNTQQGGEQGGKENGSEKSPSGAAGESGKTQDSAAEGDQPGKAGQPGSNSSNPGTKPGNGGASSSGQADQVGGSDGAATNSDPEAANEDYAKQATDLALNDLENDLRRGDVDPELLEELGWTEQDMQRFAERLRKNLSAPTGDETPQDAANRQEFQHMLENLSFGETSSPRKATGDRVQDVGEIGTVNPQVPSQYRDAFERFTRNVAGRKSSPKRDK